MGQVGTFEGGLTAKLFTLWSWVVLQQGTCLLTLPLDVFTLHLRLETFQTVYRKNPLPEHAYQVPLH